MVSSYRSTSRAVSAGVSRPGSFERARSIAYSYRAGAVRGPLIPREGDARRAWGEIRVRLRPRDLRPDVRAQQDEQRDDRDDRPHDAAGNPTGELRVTTEPAWLDQIEQSLCHREPLLLRPTGLAVGLALKERRYGLIPIRPWARTGPPWFPRSLRRRRRDSAGALYSSGPQLLGPTSCVVPPDPASLGPRDPMLARDGSRGAPDGALRRPRRDGGGTGRQRRPGSSVQRLAG